MRGCPAVCPREEISQDELSPGIIAADELIGRGAFDPSHGNARTGKIRQCLIPKAHLYGGKASVWRVGGVGISIENLVTYLTASREDPLFAILAARADDIRAIRLAGTEKRAFSLVDECECDAEGNKHPAHAHIALCQVQQSAGLSADSPAFIDAHRALIETMKRTWIWPAAPGIA